MGTYSWAIEQLKRGKKWLEKAGMVKKMFIYLVHGSVVPIEKFNQSDKLDFGTRFVTINPHIDMKTADGSITCGWVASQTDTMATDWMVVE